MTPPNPILRWFSLRHDQASTADIDAALRAGARPAGTNLWVLFFAILIASVGLNVNSTAVIIGAMLISPLMGPIVGVGYGAAIADAPLMRSSALTLLGFAAVSLMTSVIYFSISPLDEPGSELMARTTPNLWDVLIAAFGGAAGMLAATRRSFTNIAPGVAIATALMPPLCTAGFGIAHQRWDIAGGAAFLFLINSVFIAAATLLIGKLLRLPRIAELDPAAVKLHRWVIGAVLTAVLIPSVWLGYVFAEQEYFKAAVARAMRQVSVDGSIIRRDVNPQSRQITLIVIGGVDETALLSKTEEALKAQRVRDAKVLVRRPDADLWRQQSEGALARDEAIELLRSQILELQAQVERLQSSANEAKPSSTHAKQHHARPAGHPSTSPIKEK
jgi:uncharacterized hydrophobic protein (TIGR00271 family)